MVPSPLIRMREFEWGKSFRALGSVVLVDQKWDVDHYLKNGNNLFTDGTYLEEAIIWFKDLEVVLNLMGSQPCLWV